MLQSPSRPSSAAVQTPGCPCWLQQSPPKSSYPAASNPQESAVQASSDGPLTKQRRPKPAFPPGSGTASFSHVARQHRAPPSLVSLHQVLLINQTYLPITTAARDNNHDNPLTGTLCRPQSELCRAHHNIHHPCATFSSCFLNLQSTTQTRLISRHRDTDVPQRQPPYPPPLHRSFAHAPTAAFHTQDICPQPRCYCQRLILR